MFHLISRMKAVGIGGRWRRPVTPLLFSSVFLAGCATAPPPTIGNTNPANPAAERGLAEAPAALDAYKSAADFAARSNEPAGTMEGMEHGAMPGMGGGGMPGMSGMEHGTMPGMGGGMPGMPGMEHGAMPGMSGGKTDTSSKDKSPPTPAPNGNQNTVMPPDESKKPEQPGAHHE